MTGFEQNLEYLDQTRRNARGKIVIIKERRGLYVKALDL